VNKRVLVFRIRANCDVDGFVDRGAMSLYGLGDHVVGSVPIFGTIEGQGANRFTSRIHGDAEERAMVEVEARPKLSKDWSVDLNSATRSIGPNRRFSMFSAATSR
jgi:hypothetical protein